MPIDADRLTELPRDIDAADAPRRSLREATLARLLGQLSMGRLTVVTPEGRRVSARGTAAGPEATLVLHRWRALRRLIVGGDLAFSEAFIDGDWSSPDLPALIELAAHNLPQLSARFAALPPVRAWNRLRHALRRNSRTGSRRNISFHYDLGNEFYRHWLDETMSYSSAIAIAPGQSLENAQAERMEHILDRLDLVHGDRVLEIGCGWGALAGAMARRGAQVTGLTLSREQLAYAQASLAADPALAARVDLRLQDYRDVDGQYERIVSIEMLEAVGEAYWPVYFAKLRECLAPGGVALLQVITIAEDRFEGYRRNTDFIQRHIFPGGMLPTRTHIAEQARAAGLELADAAHFGAGYAQTLAEWRRRYNAARARIEPLGFGADFHRLWNYYLAYCEGGFRAGAIDVGLYRLRG
ncbi:cyclopropane-fatty-acyl-phospholipid synthase family protein [Starkeya koreensis]|uniref:Cyclopropane-fatty-acyl-phospholipid synthase family protein n=1 Tax=Ancylobacter koreensis TaxID=266121 RepID=A0ABT0DMM3_9HYPH|nr:cyclopropane-fatty-acyl-phospholipid synthase family protein [Ancylobacter koreensis]MCK0208516.1 cyclopropane-fatty-acyl-phospholipid synthase family protein [Ancylobacter koreensis]